MGGVSGVNTNTNPGQAVVDTTVAEDVAGAEALGGVAPAQAPGHTGPVKDGDKYGGVTKNSHAKAESLGNAPTGNSAIDSTLSAFAQANAANPAAMTALENTAAAIKQDPQAYINPDGTVNTQALASLISKEFATVGPVTIPAPGLIPGEGGGPGETLAFSETTADSSADPGNNGPLVTSSAGRLYNNLGSLADADIMAIAFIVMMEATKSAQEDLKSIMDGVKLINKQKDVWRNIQDENNKQAASVVTCNADGAMDRGGAASSQWGSTPWGTGLIFTDAGDPSKPGSFVLDPPGGGQTNQSISYTVLGPDGKPIPGGFTIQGTGVYDSGPPPKYYVQKADIDTAKDAIKNQLDSLSEMSETESLRLQMAMDRVSKFMQALSNIEKKMADTASAITQNLK